MFEEKNTERINSRLSRTSFNTGRSSSNSSRASSSSCSCSSCSCSCSLSQTGRSRGSETDGLLTSKIIQRIEFLENQIRIEQEKTLLAAKKALYLKKTLAKRIGKQSFSNPKPARNPNYSRNFPQIRTELTKTDPSSRQSAGMLSDGSKGEFRRKKSILF